MSFDLRKYLAEGGIEARLNEDHSGNPNDKYVVKKCTKKEGEPWAVWEGKTRVKGFASKAEAEKYAKKQNKKQNLKEGEEAQGMSDNDFIMALNKAFSAADDAMLEEGEEELEEDLYEGEEPLDEEEVDEGSRGRPAGTGRERAVNFKIFTGDRSEENILRLLKQFNKLYTSPKNPTLDPRSNKPRKPFSDEDLQNLAELFASGEPITSKKIQAAISRYNSSAPANDFLKVMDGLGRSKITSVDKKVQDLDNKAKRASGEIPEKRGAPKGPRNNTEDGESTSSSFKSEPDDEDIEDIDVSDIDDYFRSGGEDDDIFEDTITEEDTPKIYWEEIEPDGENRPDYKEGTILGASADGREWQAYGYYTEFEGFVVIDDLEEIPSGMSESKLGQNDKFLDKFLKKDLN